MSVETISELKQLTTICKFADGSFTYVGDDKQIYFRSPEKHLILPPEYKAGNLRKLDNLLIGASPKEPLTGMIKAYDISSRKVIDVDLNQMMLEADDLDYRASILATMMAFGGPDQIVKVYVDEDLRVEAALNKPNIFEVIASNVRTTVNKSKSDTSVCRHGHALNAHPQGTYGCPSGHQSCGFVYDIINNTKNRSFRLSDWLTDICLAVKDIHVYDEYMTILGDVVTIKRKSVKICSKCGNKYKKGVIVIPCGCRGFCTKCIPSDVTKCVICSKTATDYISH